MTDRIDKTALSYWFPKLEAAGLPVPKTVLLEMPLEAQIERLLQEVETRSGTA